MKFLNLKALGLACAALGCAVSTARADIIEITGDITSDARWTRDNVYVVTKVIYVLPPARLTVEPGTVIRGAKASLTGFGTSPGSIIVTRGAKIIGNGTVDDPIIWTCLDDPYVPGGVNTIPATVTGASGSVAVPQQSFALDGGNGLNAFAYSKECGGLVILGRTPLGYDRDGDLNFLQWNGTAHSGDTIAFPSSTESITTGDGTGFAVIEGLTANTLTLAEPFDTDGDGPLPATTAFSPGIFGGIDENDSSGVISFWSHRYGGFNISANNEINGVTMGGVGRGTVMEFQEVAQNADDGFEWFGGYNNCRYLASVVNGDDSFDGDFGFSGNLQNLFAINDNESYQRSGFGGGSDGTPVGRNSFAVSDKMFEWDGSEPDHSTVTPQTNAFVFNITLIGNKGANVTPANEDSAIHLLKGASGFFSHGVAEDIGGGAAGTGPLFFIANTTTPTVPTTTDASNFLYFNVGQPIRVGAGFEANNTMTAINAAAISQLRGKGHLVKNGLDPRLVNNTDANSTARDLTLPVPSRPGVTGFFAPLSYHGAMRDNNWLFGWTWTHEVQLMATTNVDRPVVDLSVAGAVVSVSFDADTNETTNGDSVLYVVERSVDGRVWTPAGVVQDGSLVNVDNQVFADANAAAGEITIADAGYTYTGTPVLYRVIPQ